MQPSTSITIRLQLSSIGHSWHFITGGKEYYFLWYFATILCLFQTSKKKKKKKKGTDCLAHTCAHRIVYVYDLALHLQRVTSKLCFFPSLRSYLPPHYCLLWFFLFFFFKFIFFTNIMSTIIFTIILFRISLFIYL